MGREYVNFVNGFSPSSRKIICNIKSKLAFINSEGICYIVNSLSPGESDFSGNSFFFVIRKIRPVIHYKLTDTYEVIGQSVLEKWIM